VIQASQGADILELVPERAQPALIVVVQLTVTAMTSAATEMAAVRYS
jgi:hypothetical protein